MIISLIAALDNNRLIGSDNDMPWHLPADFKHFKEVTMGKPVIMGRKTYESIGRPLPGRLNIVISRSDYRAEGITSAASIEDALTAAGDVEEVMIIGGANIYQQILAQANQMYLTYVDASCEGNAWFPEFDADEWEIVNQQFIKADEKNNYDFKIVSYLRK